MGKIQLLSCASADELARAAAAAWLDEIESANRAGKNHCVALSGGRIAQNFFTAVIAQNQSRKISFTNVHFFWADERCVPPTNAESNFKMASELLLAPLKVSSDKIHRLRGEVDPAAAVQFADQELRCALQVAAGKMPVLDLILLGMGEDGHIASLFPNATPEILNCATPFLLVTNSPKPPPCRISLSFAAIIAARQVWVLASGAGKETAFRASMQPHGTTPLARVVQMRDTLNIFSDIR